MTACEPFAFPVRSRRSGTSLRAIAHSFSLVPSLVRQPWFDYPPSFTLQPIPETFQKQLQVGTDLDATTLALACSLTHSLAHSLARSPAVEQSDPLLLCPSQVARDRRVRRRVAAVSE